MTNNDVLRRIRDTFELDDSKMIEIFGLVDQQVVSGQISDWLVNDDDPAFQACSDTQLAMFLNGLIIKRRGKKPGPQPEPEQQLTNNIIFKKLKIAMDMKTEDILEIMDLTDSRINKRELSAFFRKPGHKHYRECNAQLLRDFISGLQVKYRR